MVSKWTLTRSSRGHLRDCEIFGNLQIAFVSSSNTDLCSTSLSLHLDQLHPGEDAPGAQQRQADQAGHQQGQVGQAQGGEARGQGSAERQDDHRGETS